MNTRMTARYIGAFSAVTYSNTFSFSGVFMASGNYHQFGYLRSFWRRTDDVFGSGQIRSKTGGMPTHPAGIQEAQRLEMERDRQAREQRNHELQLKMLEALGGRGNQAGPSLTELVASVEALRNLAGNSGTLTGFKELLEIIDHINALRGDNKNDHDSWMSVLKSAPELAQTLTQVFLARNGQPAAAQPKPSVNGSLNPSQQSDVKTEPSLDTVPLPTAYDQVAGQLRGLLERLQVQIRAGLDP